ALPTDPPHLRACPTRRSSDLGENGEGGRGAPLTVQLNGAREITIAYETSPDADALQWLTPEQTSSGKQFLFSQGQSILTRTWARSEEHTSELQSRENLVCRLL